MGFSTHRVLYISLFFVKKNPNEGRLIVMNENQVGMILKVGFRPQIIKLMMISCDYELLMFNSLLTLILRFERKIDDSC